MNTSRLFTTPRLLPDAGYHDDPGPVPFLSKLIPIADGPKVARDVTIAARRFELWSPNSRRLPFYAGIKVPGLDLEELAEGKKRYDGHLGPLDPTYHPQHYQPRRPYLPFVRRHSHLNPPSRYPEFVSLFEGDEAWVSLASDKEGKGQIPEAYIQKLKRRNKKLLEEVGTLRDGLRESISPEKRLLWKHRPLLPADSDIERLRDISIFEEAVDVLARIQRGIKMREAWIQYVRLKDQTPIDVLDLPFIFVVEGNEEYMGVWMSDEVHEDALLYLTRSGVPCFFLHEYTPEEKRFHHRSHSLLPSTDIQGYSLVSKEDGPWRHAVRCSNLRPLLLGVGESVGRLRSLPGYVPLADSLSLSNRQGYREPSLRDKDQLPYPRTLKELEKRPVTPLRLWHNSDGLNEGANSVPSIQVLLSQQGAAPIPRKKPDNWSFWKGERNKKGELEMVKANEPPAREEGYRSWLDRELLRELFLKEEDLPSSSNSQEGLGRPAPATFYWDRSGGWSHASERSQWMYEKPEQASASKEPREVHSSASDPSSSNPKGKQREVSPLSSYRSSSDEALPVVPELTAAPSDQKQHAGSDSARTASEHSQDAPVTLGNPLASAVLSERAQELYAAYSFEVSEYWRIDEMPSGAASIDDLLELLRGAAKKIPFAVDQILRTWKNRRAVYWLQFRDKDQALRARGYLSSTRDVETKGCDGPLVPEEIYKLAIAEVRNPEERPPSPSAHWNLPVGLDAKFLEDPSNLFSPALPPPTPSERSFSSSSALTFPSASASVVDIPESSSSLARSPPSPPLPQQISKRSRINSPPRQFVASRSTRTTRENIITRNSRNYRPLSEQITAEASSAMENLPTTPRAKGPESRAQHNRFRYHRK